MFYFFTLQVGVKAMLLLMNITFSLSYITFKARHYRLIAFFFFKSTTFDFTKLCRETHSFTKVCKYRLHDKVLKP